MLGAAVTLASIAARFGARLAAGITAMDERYAISGRAITVGGFTSGAGGKRSGITGTREGGSGKGKSTEENGEGSFHDLNRLSGWFVFERPVRPLRSARLCREEASFPVRDNTPQDIPTKEDFLPGLRQVDVS